VGALLLSLAAGGCNSSASGGLSSPFLPSDTVSVQEPTRDSALAVLNNLQRTAFDSAFAALDTYTMTRRLRTEQLTPAGSVAAMQAYTVRFPPAPAPGTIQARDSSGTFPTGGFLGTLSSPETPTARPQNAAPQALSDPPPYIAPRTREAFRYALTADTLADGTPVQVVRTQARDTRSARDQGVRFARLTLLHDSHELVRLTVVRAERSLLFWEDSRLTIHLRPAPDADAWVPALVRFQARVDIPFRAPRRFRTVSRYTDYAR
jgi:hypothetical protein